MRAASTRRRHASGIPLSIEHGGVESRVDAKVRSAIEIQRACRSGGLARLVSILELLNWPLHDAAANIESRPDKLRVPDQSHIKPLSTLID